jgi:hypothetical protein
LKAHPATITKGKNMSKIGLIGRGMPNVDIGGKVPQ